MKRFEFVKTNADSIKLEQAMYAHAYDMGMTFTQFLENIDPSDPKDAKDGLDAFERQLMRFQIRTKNDPKTGIGASTGELFFRSSMPEARILFPEYLNRESRQAVMEQQDILDQMIAATEMLQGTALMRAIYIDDTQTQRTMKRVGEFGEFPIVKISWSEKATTLAKYGVRMQMSYEFVRTASLPIISIFIRRVMRQSRLDEVAMAISALQLGDGSGHASAGAISSSNLSTHQGGSPTGTQDMTYAGYLTWLLTFAPGACTTILSNNADTVKYLTLSKPSVDPLFMYELLSKVLLGGAPTTPVNWPIKANIYPVIHADVLANNLIGIDKSAALIACRQAGADLTETDKIIQSQFNEIVISNTIGFQTLFASARKLLVTNA